MIDSDKIILKTLEIIDYFSSGYWFLENPQTGGLKNREVVKGLHFYDVDYCKYCDWGYKKRTRIWTNRTTFKPLLCKNDCENMVFIDNQKLHKERMGTSKTIKDGDKIIRCNSKALRAKYRDFPNIQKEGNAFGKGTTLEDRYRIPPKLIYSLFCEQSFYYANK